MSNQSGCMERNTLANICMFACHRHKCTRTEYYGSTMHIHKTVKDWNSSATS